MTLQLGPDYIHPSSELLGLTFQDITHPEDLETDLAQVRLLLGGEIPSYAMEKRYLHRGSAPPLPSTCSGRRDGRQAWCG